MIHEPAKRGGQIWMSNSHWGIKPTATGFPLTTKLNSGNIGKSVSHSEPTHTQPRFATLHCNQAAKCTCRSSWGKNEGFGADIK